MAQCDRWTRAPPKGSGINRSDGTQADHALTFELDQLGGADHDYDRLHQRLISKIELSDVSASFVMEEIKETTQLPL